MNQMQGVTWKQIKLDMKAKPTRNLKKAFKDSFQRVKCESKTIYAKNPLTTKAEPQKEGAMRNWIIKKLYAMPEDVPNPLCWKVRCDYVWRDFLEEFAVSRSEEPVFWATVIDSFQGSRCPGVPWSLNCSAFSFEMTLVKEVEQRRKTVFYWWEHSYELRNVGYNGNPTDYR